MDAGEEVILRQGITHERIAAGVEHLFDQLQAIGDAARALVGTEADAGHGGGEGFEAFDVARLAHEQPPRRDHAAGRTAGAGIELLACDGGLGEGEEA